MKFVYMFDRAQRARKDARTAVSRVTYCRINIQLASESALYVCDALLYTACDASFFHDDKINVGEVFVPEPLQKLPHF